MNDVNVLGRAFVEAEIQKEQVLLVVYTSSRRRLEPIQNKTNPDNKFSLLHSVLICSA